MSQTERLFYITSRLKDHGSITVKEISQEFEVTERSAKRDIEYLRDRCGCNIIYSQQKKNIYPKVSFRIFHLQET